MHCVIIGWGLPKRHWGISVEIYFPSVLLLSAASALAEGGFKPCPDYKDEGSGTQEGSRSAFFAGRGLLLSGTGNGSGSGLPRGHWVRSRSPPRQPEPEARYQCFRLFAY